MANVKRWWIVLKKKVIVRKGVEGLESRNRHNQLIKQNRHMYGKGYSIVAKNLDSEVLLLGSRCQLHSLLLM